MPQPSPQLALVAIDTLPHRHESRERIGAATGPGWFDSSWICAAASKSGKTGRTTSASATGSTTS
jgi:hypothetical protein